MKQMIAFVAGVVIVLLVAVSTVFVVDLRHVAIVSSSNHAAPVLVGPGIHVKLPPPFQRITPVDTRVQAFSPPEAVRCTTSDKASLLVMPVIRYRVSEPLKLYAATKSDPKTLPDHLVPLVRNALVAAFSRYTFSNALAQQPDVAHIARDALKAGTASLGLDVLEVEFTRVDYPQEQTGAVYQRMNVALTQNGTSVPQTVQGASAVVSAAAVQPPTPFLQAQAIRANADAQAAAIVAQAGTRDPKFYTFWQRMQAYRASFKPGDVLVLDSSNDFFRFMRNPDATGNAAANGAGGKEHKPAR